MLLKVVHCKNFLHNTSSGVLRPTIRNDAMDKVLREKLSGSGYTPGRKMERELSQLRISVIGQGSSRLGRDTA